MFKDKLHLSDTEMKQSKPRLTHLHNLKFNHSLESNREFNTANILLNSASVLIILSAGYFLFSRYATKQDNKH